MEFISGTFDKKTGISTVVMEHLGVRFEGIARLHPDDIDNASEFAGCSFAETRATIKALKYERKMVKEKAEQARKFIKQCECYKNWDPESSTARAAYRQMNRYVKKVKQLTDIINYMDFKLKRSMWDRDITLKAFERNKTKKFNLQQ